jgi:hypothetical protein
MIRARAVKRNQASSPFGAPHRIYFDTPPLGGYTFVDARIRTSTFPF